MFASMSVPGCAPERAPAPPPPDTAAIRKALVAQEAAVLAALQHKDVAALVALFTEDGIWISSDAVTGRGRDEISKMAKADFDATVTAQMDPWTIDQLIVVSDSEAVTFSHGYYRATLRGKKPEHRHNPFADYWRRGTDGAWRIAYEINADGPVPDGAPAAKP